jgi:hypothetical protein|tara:strand:- start:1651 stop:2199 length:549 start_codon:yes stop_codon:yes gene_type:complete
MIRKQLSLFEPKTHVNNTYVTDKPVDVSTIMDKNDIIIKDKYFIYPNHGTHPFEKYDKKLSSHDYPFLEDRHYKKTGNRGIVTITTRKGIIYPYVSLQRAKIAPGQGEQKLICFHKLVGRAFLDPGELDPYDNSTVVDHIDGKVWDYRISNLRFVTRSANTKGNKNVPKNDIFEVAKLEGRF